MFKRRKNNVSIKNISKDLGVLKTEQLNEKNTVVINFGFSKELIDKELHKQVIDNSISINETLKDYRRIFFIDEHTEKSPEFLYFKEHGLSKQEIIDEFNKFKDEKAIVIPKNSSNGFVSAGFSKWLDINMNSIRNYVLTGMSIDIDILQFALTLKAFFNEWDAPTEVIIPIKAVESLNIEKNYKDIELAKVNALYLLKNNGITLVSDIKSL